MVSPPALGTSAAGQCAPAPHTSNTWYSARTGASLRDARRCCTPSTGAFCRAGSRLPLPAREASTELRAWLLPTPRSRRVSSPEGDSRSWLCPPRPPCRRARLALPAMRRHPPAVLRAQASGLVFSVPHRALDLIDRLALGASPLARDARSTAVVLTQARLDAAAASPSELCHVARAALDAARTPRLDRPPVERTDPLGAACGLESGTGTHALLASLAASTIRASTA